MRSRITITELMLLSLIFAATSASAQEKVLYSFGGAEDGSHPNSGIIADAVGNLYGTTTDGGAHGRGTAFKLSRMPDGQWAEQTLHTFTCCTDGSDPYGSLTFDSAGDLYGTTFYGGSGGLGSVFELMPTKSGEWKEKILYGFGGGDGNAPSSGVIFDSQGNLYGTTAGGGTDQYGPGVVFELMPGAGGVWAEKVLYVFKTNDGWDGSAPYGGLVFDSSGNLYGTTSSGGLHGLGTVFEVSPADGAWTEKLVYSFSGSDGLSPYSTPSIDANGNLYGTTYYGGPFSQGTVFQLTLASGGHWSDTVLDGFQSDSEGAFPGSDLTFGAAGSLYGVSKTGGTGICAEIGIVVGCGTAFELTQQAGGTWSATTLYNFRHDATDGTLPTGALYLDAAGNIYGTASEGGRNGDGAVFEIGH
jgi:uncharacterized repeat protein (TIGR03803 family)